MDVRADAGDIINAGNDVISVASQFGNRSALCLKLGC
jgi:hypothetical protein